MQRAHRLLAEQTKTYPRFERPGAITAMTVADVMHAPEGHARNTILDEWGQSVWTAWHNQHERVKELIGKYHFV